MTTLSLRLRNSDDLKLALDDLIKNKNIKAACILTCVGSLQKVAIRFANQSETEVLSGRFEIVSLVGTLSKHGLHLHISIADHNGKMIGGHLMSNCEVFTTAEIVIGILPNVEFLKKYDAVTDYKELVIKQL